MSRKVKPLSKIERAVQALVADEAQEVQRQLDAALARVKYLEGVLGGISRTAYDAVGEGFSLVREKLSLPAALAAQVAAAEQEVPADAPVDLAGQDNLGDGRWL